MENYFNKFNNIFHGIIAIPLLIFIFLFLQLDTGKMIAPFEGRDYMILSIITFVINIAYLIWVFRIFRKERKQLIGKFSLQERLENYLKASTKFYVLMTLSGIASILIIYLTGEMLFAFIYILQLFLLSVYRPSVHNICKYLDLKEEEREFVLKKKEFSDEEGA